MDENRLITSYLSFSYNYSPHYILQFLFWSWYVYSIKKPGQRLLAHSGDIISVIFSAPAHEGSHPRPSHAPPSPRPHPYPRSAFLWAVQAPGRSPPVSCIPSGCSGASRSSSRREAPAPPGTSDSFRSGRISHCSPPCRRSSAACPCHRLHRPLPSPSASSPAGTAAGSRTGSPRAHTRRSCRTGHVQGRPWAALP